MRAILKIGLSTLMLSIVSFSTGAQVRFGPELGFNCGLQRSVNEGPETSTSRSSTLKVGATAGINVDIKVVKKCYIQTGLFYIYDNIKFKNNVDLTAYNLGTGKGDEHDDIHRLKIPIYIMYKSGYDGSGRFMAGIGPYIAYTFLANTNVTTPGRNADSTAIVYTQINHQFQLGNSSNDDQRNWDYGVTTCIGYESNVGIFFRGSFNWGLHNMIPQGSDNNKLQNWGAAFTIGYNIGKDNW